MNAVTEKQAAGMWCPQVRMTALSVRSPQEYTYDELAFNRSETMADATRCIGSRCMAWRWAEPEQRRVRHPGKYREPGSPEPIEHREALGVPATWTWDADADAQDGCHWVEPLTEAEARRRGYCGLAGQP